MSDRYYYGLGRRKEASAQVRIVPQGSGSITVNGREMDKYFTTYQLRQSVHAPFLATGTEGKFDVIVTAEGGGIRGQAESVRLGISRALIEFNPEFRGSLKKIGFLTRDPRKRERKKYGRKSARRSPQWAKR